jgi:hypothetical protein
MSSASRRAIRGARVSDTPSFRDRVRPRRDRRATRRRGSTKLASISGVSSVEPSSTTISSSSDSV